MHKQLLLILLVFACFASSIQAQIAVRPLPFYLNPEFSKYYPNPKYFPSSFKYVPTPMPPEAYKHKAPDRIQNADAGFDMINVSNLNGHQSETWMAIHPQNPNIMIATSNDFAYNHRQAGYRMSSWISTDAGKTWKHSLAPSNIQAGYINVDNTGATNFDPAITFNADGTAYYAYGFCQVPADNLEGDNGIFFTTSTDGGKTWGEIEPIAIEFDGTTSQPFHDRYTIASDNNPESPYKNNVYISWQRFRVNPAIVLARYDPNNGYWESPKVLGTGATQAPMPAVGPDGELYVAWHSRASNENIEAVFVKSTNGGTTFSTPRTAQAVKTVGTINQQSGRNVLADKQNIRVSSVLQIAVDRSNGPRRGWVYIVQAGKELDNSGRCGVYITRSTNGGTTWSPSQRIDENPLRNDVFFPSLAIDQVTGMVSVFYYSSQNDPNNVGVDGYIAYSTDGVNFSNIRVTPKTIYLNTPGTVSQQGTGNYYWGDYTHIVSHNGMIYPLFWWPTATNYNEWSLELFTVRLGNAPKPPSNVQAQNIPVFPAEVKLTWTDPTEDLFGGALGNFKIKVYRGDDYLADVNKGVLEYTDKTVVDGTSYTYKLAAELENGSQSIFAEVTIIAGGALQPKAPTDLTPRPNESGVLLSWLNPSHRIDDTEFTDFEKVKIYANGALTMTVDKAQVQAGKYSQALVELETGKFHKIKITAVGKRGDTETESAFSTEVIAYAGAPLTAVDENFDGSSVIPFYTNKNWGLTTEKAQSLPNSFTDSPGVDYDSRAETNAIFAPFTITPDNMTLSFEHIALIEKNDWGYVSISRDFGKTWLDLKKYNVESSDKFIEKDLDASDWESVHIGLGKYLGDTLYVQFRLVSDILRVDKGWFIDNVRIDDNPNSVEGMPLSSNLRLSAYPNPAEDFANINIHLPITGNLSLELYDALGNRLNSIANGFYQAGAQNFTVNTAKLTGGFYYIRASISGATKTIAIVVAK